GLLVTGEGVVGRVPGEGDGVADLDPVDLLDPGDQIGDLAGTDLAHRDRLGGQVADLVGIVNLAGGHESDRVTGPEPPVDHPDVANHSPEGVEVGVEHQCPQG